MDIRKIKKLIELVQESDIAELEINEGEESVRIIRHSPVATMPQAYLAPASSVAPAAPVTRKPASQDNETEGHALLSPMVGTVYFSDRAEAAPLCQLGQRVEEGDTVCVIEAMTMTNKIAADASGIIKTILVEEGEPVDFGQPLLTIQ